MWWALLGMVIFEIGDTLAEDPSLVYHEIPRFAPNVLHGCKSPSTAQFKRFREGLENCYRKASSNLSC